jgi:hypothetical protein
MGLAVSDTELQSWIDRGLIDPATLKAPTLETSTEPDNDPADVRCSNMDSSG